MKSSWIITFLKAGLAHASFSVGAGAEQRLEGRGARMPRALGTEASLVRVLMRCGCVLMTVLAVVERGLGMLLGVVMLARIVVMGCLQVVVSGGRVVGGSLEMGLGGGVLGSRRHRSILLGCHLGCDRSFLVSKFHSFSFCENSLSSFSAWSLA